MSTKHYREIYDTLTDKQKDILWDLYMKGINHDGHSWHTYTDIEIAVAELLEAERERYERGIYH